MKKKIMLDVNEMLCRLDSWYSKIQDCYKDEVWKSMSNFKKEYGLTNNEDKKVEKYLVCPSCSSDLKLELSFDGCDYDCEKGEGSGYKYLLEYCCVNDDCRRVFHIGRLKKEIDFSETVEKFRSVKFKGNV